MADRAEVFLTLLSAQATNCDFGLTQKFVEKKHEQQ